MMIRDTFNYGFDGKGWIPLKVNSVTGMLLVSDTAWADTRFDYTSGNLDYKGSSETNNPSTSAGEHWHIWKYTWVGDNPTRVQYLIGNWDDRATLGW